MATIGFGSCIYIKEYKREGRVGYVQRFSHDGSFQWEVGTDREYFPYEAMNYFVNEIERRYNESDIALFVHLHEGTIIHTYGDLPYKEATS